MTIHDHLTNQPTTIDCCTLLFCRCQSYQAAARMNTLMTLSSWSTIPLEEVAQSGTTLTIYNIHHITRTITCTCTRRVDHSVMQHDNITYLMPSSHNNNTPLHPHIIPILSIIPPFIPILSPHSPHIINSTRWITLVPIVRLQRP